VSWCDAVVFANKLSEKDGLAPVYALPGGMSAGLDSEACNDLAPKVTVNAGADGYRLGVFVGRANGRDYYWHSGYWGTVAYYVPDTGIAVAGVTNNQDAYRRLVNAVQKAAGVAAP
jgi:CubicO group peptidase (beta-lactamase class C family)